ncbi:MAG: enoyl-CoA hydratase/isomerase family protein [Pseudoxanthomonas sp.]
MTTLVQTIAHGQVRELRMARPPVNAFDDALCHALQAALRAACDDGVDALVLSGGEKVFSAGLDVPHLLSHGSDRTALHASWSAFLGLARALAEAPVPVAAAITGHAPAGGCVLVLCCDWRVMARSVDPARPYAIGLNEVQVGLTVPAGIQQLMRRTVGARQAERLLVAGAMLPAEDALRIGLVDELADGAAAVIERAVAWLHELLRRPRGPMLATRAIARAGLHAAMAPQALDLERFVEGWYAADTQAALQAVAARLGK